MEFKVFDLGVIDFNQAQSLQKETFLKVKTGLLKSALILCQHYPVITLGRRSDKKNILASLKDLRDRKIEVCQAERGGEVTYHGPGQLVIYPIFNLSYLKKDIDFFLRYLEGITINLLKDFGITAQRRLGLTGVWVGKEKIASIGIAIKNWITFHGLSINIKRNDLANFSFIRPCGMDIKVTALEKVLGRDIEIDEIKEKIIGKFKEDI